MSENWAKDRVPISAESLLAGPRGRRLLLEFALLSERLGHAAINPVSLNSLIFFATHYLYPENGAPVVYRSKEVDGVGRAAVSSEDFAEILAQVVLADVTPALLHGTLAITVDSAMYWQEPDSQDVLISADPMCKALSHVAKHVAASPHTLWWASPVAEHAQWGVLWDGQERLSLETKIREHLQAEREAMIAAEDRARHERPADPSANWSGNWWSFPSWKMTGSTRELLDGSPVALRLVEDGPITQQATTVQMHVPAGLRLFEIDSAGAWADLCRRFPIEVTAQKRHDWYRTTGRAGRWVIPDWFQVSQHYDAVHLQVSAYLAAAGTAIQVDDEMASVIAGWDPDKTYWFTNEVTYTGNGTRWVMDSSYGDAHWVRGEP